MSHGALIQRIRELETKLDNLAKVAGRLKARAMLAERDTKLLNYRDSKWNPSWRLPIGNRTFRGSSYRDALRQHMEADGQ